MKHISCIALIVFVFSEVAGAYTSACVTDQTLKNVSCSGQSQAGSHHLDIAVQLEEGTLKQNSQALPSKVCTEFGPSTHFSMMIKDSTINRVIGFFSKFGSNNAGESGDKPDMNTLFGKGVLKIKAYAFDYGDLVQNEDVIFTTHAGEARAQVHIDLQENTGEVILPINTSLDCAVR